MKHTCRIMNGETVWEPPLSEHEIAEGKARLTEMLETRQLPYIMTDSVFLADTENGRQFQGHEDVGDRLKELADEAGQDVKGKVYKSGLARYPGDPEAWIGGRGDAQRVFEKNLAPLGWNAEGAIKGKGEKREPPKRPRLAADIVDRFVEKELESHPEPHKVDIVELREKVIHEHGKD